MWNVRHVRVAELCSLEKPGKPKYSNRISTEFLAGDLILHQLLPLWKIDRRIAGVAPDCTIFCRFVTHSLSLSLSLPLSFSINATKSIRRVCITNVTRLLVSHLLIANWLTISQGFEQVERTRRVSSFFATNGLSALDIFYKLSQNAWKGRRGIPLIPSCELSKFPQLLPRRGRTTPILPAIILRFVV